MAITWINAGALAVSATVTPITLVAPACSVGDLLVACLINKELTVTISPPAGGAWTEIIQEDNDCTDATDDHRYAIFWRYAETSGGSYAFSKSADNNICFAGVIGVWRGVHATVPIDATAPARTETVGVADNVSFPAFDPTAVANETVFVAFYGDDNTAYSAAMSGDTNPDCTNRWDLHSSLGSDCGIACTSGPNNGGAIAARTWASNSTIDAGNTGVVFALVVAPLTKALADGITLTDSPVKAAATALADTVTLADDLGADIIERWITPVEVTPGTLDAWTDVDVSSYVPAGSTGVILHIVKTHAAGQACTVRKNGSSDNRLRIIDTGERHQAAFVGLDGSLLFEAYVSTTTGVDIYLVGYFDSRAAFITNAVNKSPTAGAWNDMDCAAQAPSATGLMFEVDTSSLSQLVANFRKNGSTDDRSGTGARTHYHNCFGRIVGCDASQIAEGYRGSISVVFWLVGYITSGVTWNTNATDYSIGSTGAWTDLSALPSGATGGFFEVSEVASALWGLRKNRSVEDIYTGGNSIASFGVRCDAWGLVEGEVSDLAQDWWLSGYTVSATPTDWTKELSDSLALADAFSGAFAKYMADTLAVADASAVASGKVLADSVALTDDFSRTVDWSRAPEDTVSLSDAASAAVGKSLADDLSLADAYSIAAGLALSDTLGLADSVAQAIGKGLGDSITLSDLFSSVVEFARALTDSVSLADAFFAATGKVLADGITLTDFFDYILTPGGGVALTLDLMDALTLVDARTSAIGKGLADTLTLADLMVRFAEWYRSLADGVALSDVSFRAPGMTLADGITVADAPILNTGKALADGVTLSDGMATASQVFRVLADAIVLSDSEAASMAKVLADALSLSDSRNVGVGKGLTDTLTLNDVSAAAFGKALADALGISDSHAAVLGGAFAVFRRTRYLRAGSRGSPAN